MAWIVVKFNARDYFFNVILPLSLIFVISYIPQYYLFCTYWQDSVSGFIMKVIMSFVYTSIVIVLLSNKKERIQMVRPFKKIFCRYL